MDDLTQVELVKLTPDQKKYIAELAVGNATMDMKCPRCGRKYGEHVIGGEGDPCRVH